VTDRADAAPAIVVVLTADLMARIPLGDLLRRLGFAANFVRDETAFVAGLTDAGERAALGVIDMNRAIDWEAIAAYAAGANRATLLGFGPHVDVDGRRAAKAAGLDRIVSNGEWHRDAAALIARYARVRLAPDE
jgi:hypothetical protein